MQFEEIRALNLIRAEAPRLVGEISTTKRKYGQNLYTTLYKAMRSGDTEFFKKISAELQSCDHQEAESLISLVYEELKVRNVPLTFEMEFCVESSLIERRLFTKKTNDKQLINPKERCEFTKECLNHFKEQKEYNEISHFIAKSIAKNIRVLKRQLKSNSGYQKLPWEEIEFCLAAFIRARNGLDEQDFLFRIILSQKRITKHLEMFLQSLSCEDFDSEYKDLREDYRMMKDVYSLNKIIFHVNCSTSADLNKSGELVIERTLQIVGEYLKNTAHSPHISQATEMKLYKSTLEQFTEELRSIRNYLSHKHALPYHKIRSIEAKLQKFLKEIKNDLKKVRVEMTLVVLHLKYEIYRIFLEKLIRLETQQEFQNICYEIAPFWNDQVSQMKCDIEESIETEEGCKYFDDKTKEVKHYENAYLDILAAINLLIQAANQNFDSVRDSLVRLSSVVKLEQQVNKLSALFKSTLRLGRPKYPPFTLSSWNGILARRTSLIQIIRKEMISENERQVRHILNQIETYLVDQSQIKPFREKIRRRKLLHDTKILANLALHRIYDRPDLKKHIKKLFAIAKADKHLQKASNVKTIYEFQKHIKRVNDPYELLMKSVVTSNSRSLTRSLQKFLKNVITIPRQQLKDVVDCFEKRKLKEKEMHLLNLKDVLNTNTGALNELALEMVWLDISEIYSSATCPFDDVGFLDEGNPILVGKSLRNYLAHGDPLIDVLGYNPKVSLQAHISFLGRNPRPLSSIAHLLFGTEDHVSIEELKQRYFRGLFFAKSQEELFQAIKAGSIESVTTCLKKGAEPKGISANGRTVLHLAAASNNVDIINMFLPRKARIWDNVVQETSIANSNEILNNISYLVEIPSVTPQSLKFDDLGVLLEARFSSSCLVIFDTILHLATTAPITTPLDFRYTSANAEEIHKAGLNFDAKFCDNFDHCSFGHDGVESISICRKLEDNDDEVTNVTKRRTYNGELLLTCEEQLRFREFYDKEGPRHCLSLLTMASKLGQKNNVKQLIGYGIIPTERNALALFEAARNGFEEIVHLLVKCGANVNDKLEGHCTALHAATANGHFDIVRLLLKHNAKVDVLTEQCSSPLIVASNNGFVNIVKLLLAKGADPNAIATRKIIPDKTEHCCQPSDDKQQDSRRSLRLKLFFGEEKFILYRSKAIHFASSKGNLEIVELLRRYCKKEEDLNVALCLAAENSHKETVRSLLASGANAAAFVKIKPSSKYSATVLLAAYKVDDCEMVKILVEAGAPTDSILAINSYPAKVTPLHFAAKLGLYQITKWLLENNPKLINVLDDFNRTALFYACRYGQREIVQLLLNHKAEVQVYCLQGAVASNSIDTVKDLLEHHKYLISEDVKFGNKSLLLAQQLGYLDIADLLLERGAKITVYLYPLPGCSTLHLACLKGNEKNVLRLLHSEKSQVDTEDRVHSTPLHYAVQREQENIVEMLLDEGADPTRINSHHSVLHAAVSSGNINIVKMLIKKIRAKRLDMSGQINVKDSEGDTPLMWAAETGQSSMALLLLKNGALVSMKNYKGETALHWALKSCDAETVQVLLECGADVGVKCSSGKTALDILIEMKSCGNYVLFELERIENLF